MTNSSDSGFHSCSYHNYLTSDNVVFNTKLQELTQQVNYICFLEMTGKISPDISYKEIHAVWTNMEQQKKLLDISNLIKHCETAIQV